MRRPLAYPLLFLLLFPPPPVSAETNTSTAELKESAKRRRLQEHRYWHALLHYKTGVFGTESLVDDRNFFLSPRGKTDPAAELDAGIDGFFAQGGEERTLPRCRFPARYDWLIQRLAADLSRLPAVSFRTLEGNMEKIDAKSASLVFSS